MDEKTRERFIQDANKYIAMNTSGKFPINNNSLWPIYEDDQIAGGGIDAHYFLQDIYMAKEVMKHPVKLHYDIGSSVTREALNKTAK